MRETRSYVIYAACLLEIRKMTTGARRVQSNIDSGCRALVTGIAGHRSMRSQEREPILVADDGCLRRSLPSPHRVTAFAIRPELSSVEIRVAAGTFYRRLGKYLRDVARITRHRFVHASQRETGLGGVIELGLRSQGSPAGLGMAILARDGDGPVRVPDGLCGGNQGQPSSYCQHPRDLHPNAYPRNTHCLPSAPRHPTDSGELLYWYLIGLCCPALARNKENWSVKLGVYLSCKPVRYRTT